MKNYLILGLLICVMFTSTSCGSGGSDDSETQNTTTNGPGKADDLIPTAHPATMDGWSLSPLETITEAWLVPNQVVIRFHRATRSHIDLKGNARQECETLVAADAQLIVLKQGLPYSSATSEFSVRVMDQVSSPTGNGETVNIKFEDLTFADWKRPGSGETAWMAAVPEFGIASRCSGSADTVSQYSRIARTYEDGTTADFEYTTILSGVLSIDTEGSLTPLASCETMKANGLPEGAIVERCVGAPSDLAKDGYSQLSVTLFRSDMSGLSELNINKNYNLWLMMNGISGFYAMVCRADVRYPTETWICRLTVTNIMQPGLLYQDGPIVDGNLFKWARKDEGKTINVWEIQFAAVDENDIWADNGGNNYKGRIEEQSF